eukprot:3510485-Lingulodinium_polyedra.AAC.1
MARSTQGVQHTWRAACAAYSMRDPHIRMALMARASRNAHSRQRAGNAIQNIAGIRSTQNRQERKSSCSGLGGIAGIVRGIGRQ